MNGELLGLNHLVSDFATLHTVSPLSSALSSGHFRIAPPKDSSANPRCFSYHAASALGSPVLLKKTPPIPVTFAIAVLLWSREVRGGEKTRRTAMMRQLLVTVRHAQQCRLAPRAPKE